MCFRSEKDGQRGLFHKHRDPESKGDLGVPDFHHNVL